MSQKMKISELIPHEKNDYFFDDIKGDAWTEFIESIKTSGVIEPIVVTQNKVIVSGHQRVRACKLLEIEDIDAEVKIIDSEDELIKQLIETNIRQRGIGNTNPVKFGRCIKELERIYGIKVGNPHYDNSEINSELKTQDDLANEIGVDVRTLRNYKSLADVIPEIQTLIETGIVTPTTARAIVKKLTKDQQRELANQFVEKGEKVTGKQVDEDIKKIKSELEEVKEENKTLREANQDLGEERDYYQAMYEEEKDKEPEIVTEKVEVVPDDYEELKDLAEEYRKEKRGFDEEIHYQYEVMAKKDLSDFVSKYKYLIDPIALMKDFINGK